MRSARSDALTAGLVLVTSFGFAPAARAAGAEPVPAIISSIVLAADYPASRTVYAYGARAECASDCALLIASSDGARRWAAPSGRGWAGGEVGVVRQGATGAIVSTAPSGVQVSVDGGATFTAPAGPSGRLTVPRADSAEVAVSGQSAPALFRVHDGATRSLPPFGVGDATLYLSPAHGAVTTGPSALVAGRARDTGFPVVQRCDAALACDEGTVLLPKSDAPRLYLSPRFDSDGVVVATITTGAMFVSRDHGSTFTPVPVQRPGADSAIVTVQSIAFTPDFDARSGTGSVYAATLAVRNRQDGGDPLHGGVFRARGPFGPWRKFGGSSRLDRGATTVAAAPDGRVYAAYLDGPRSRAGVICARSGAWAAGCAFPRAASASASPAPDDRATPPAGTAPTAPASTGAATTRPSPPAVRSAAPAAGRRTPVEGRGTAAAASAAGLLVAVGAGVAWWRRRARAA